MFTALAYRRASPAPARSGPGLCLCACVHDVNKYKMSGKCGDAGEKGLSGQMHWRKCWWLISLSARRVFVESQAYVTVARNLMSLQDAPVEKWHVCSLCPCVQGLVSQQATVRQNLQVPSCRSFVMHPDHWHVFVSQDAYKHRSTVVDISTASPSKIGRIDVFDAGKTTAIVAAAMLTISSSSVSYFGA